MGAIDVGIVGRDGELRSAHAVLSDETSAVVVFRGGAGIGKTTLWDATRTAAASAGRTVLVARPLEAERRLGLAALADLLEPIADEVLPHLPAPQRRALESVLLVSRPRGDPPDARTVGAAVLGSLRIVGRERGALLAVDDLQWIDAASRAAVEFALRRLSGAGASALLALRTGGGEEALPAFDPQSAVRVIDVAPLSLGAVQRLIATRLGVTFPRPVLRRVFAASAGNPLYAIEIARALLDLHSPLSIGEELPIPRNLDGLLRARVGVLPPSTRQALAAAASLAAPRAELVEREGDLQPALDQGLVRVEHGLVRFSHPLLASAALSLLAPKRRRELHGRLADVVDDVEERARHLAFAHPERDESVAIVCERAASRAAARGAPGAAGELLELAQERTAHPERLQERGVAAAGSYARAGEVVAARRLAESAIAEMAPGPERARVLVLLSSVSEHHLPTAGALALQAWAEASGDPAVEALAAARASFTLSFAGDIARSREFAQHAIDRADLLPDATLVGIISQRGFLDILATGRADPEQLARGIAAEDRIEGISEGGSARLVFAIQLLLDEQLAEARVELAKLGVQLEAIGDEYRIAEMLYHVAEIETRAGRPAAGAAAAAKATEVNDPIEMDHVRAANAFFTAHASAYLGLTDEARATAEAGLAAATRAGDWAFTVQNSAVLGFLELSLGNAKATVDVLAPIADQIAAMAPGMHPALAPVLPNLVEALITLGRYDEARLYLDRLEERGRTLESAWALSQAARGRGLIAAAEGELETALTWLEEALREHERMEGPFERGRTLLAQGAVLRRARHWRAARESLAAALAVFEEIEAPLWAAKARSELRRVGGRSAALGLTPTEQRVAQLVASGRSNKEVAAELFVTVRTVESNLSRIYVKLGVRSRTELAARLRTA